MLPYCFSPIPQKIVFVKDIKGYLSEKDARSIDDDVNSIISKESLNFSAIAGSFRDKYNADFRANADYKKAEADFKNFMNNKVPDMSNKMEENKMKLLNLADTFKKLQNKKSFNLVITVNEPGKDPVVEIK